MTLNGCLAGLVAITAPCAFVSVGSSVIIGSIAGVLVVLAVQFFDKIKIDDPVGATSVHLVNGVFGTICVGLFGTADRVGPRTGNGAIVEALKTDPNAGAGLFMGGGFHQLGVQLMGVAMMASTLSSRPSSSGRSARPRSACGSRRTRRRRAWTSANTAWRRTPALRFRTSSLKLEASPGLAPGEAL
jgi:hypothetical protein